MVNLKKIIGIVFACIMMFGIPVEVTTGNHSAVFRDQGATPSAIDITQVLPDPDFETEPDAFVNGSSGEFSHSYSGSSMVLNWTHTKDTELDFRSIEDSTYPNYNDFVYFVQSFDWSYEAMPKDAEIYLNFSTTLSGSFNTEESADNMFKLYVWLIDSSDNWDRVFYSNPPYASVIQQRRVDLNYFDIVAGWRGMVEDEDGVQEDPQDVLTLGVGLAPTYFFSSSLENGSVAIEVTSLLLYVFMEAEPNPASYLTPLYNNTFGSKVRDFFPSFSEGNPDVWDRFRGTTFDPEGNLYVTGESFTSFELRETYGLYASRQFLYKYNPVLRRGWLIRNDNLTRPRAIAFHDDNLFTTGYFYGYESPDYHNLMLTKWSTNGQKIWEKEWGAEYDQIGVALGVHSDGSIYVMASENNIRSEPTFENSILLKFDSSGDLLWAKPEPLSTYLDVEGDLWVTDSQVISHIAGNIACFDLDGNILWNSLAHAACYDGNEFLYTAESTGIGVLIKKVDLQGNETLLANDEIEYQNNWLEDLRAYDIALTPNDELLVLMRGERYDESYFLLKHSLDGTLQQTWTIGNDYWPVPSGFPFHVDVTSTGLAYITFDTMTQDVWTQAYIVGEYSLPPLGPDTFTIVVVGGGIAAIALIAVYLYKKKQV
jgi:hypothetical protein